MTDPRYNPIVLQLVLDNLTSETIPDLTSYPCSEEQFLAIKRETLALAAGVLQERTVTAEELIGSLKTK